MHPYKVRVAHHVAHQTMAPLETSIGALVQNLGQGLWNFVKDNFRRCPLVIEK